MAFYDSDDEGLPEDLRGVTPLDPSQSLFQTHQDESYSNGGIPLATSHSNYSSDPYSFPDVPSSSRLMGASFSGYNVSPSFADERSATHEHLMLPKDDSLFLTSSTDGVRGTSYSSHELFNQVSYGASSSTRPAMAAAAAPFQKFEGGCAIGNALPSYSNLDDEDLDKFQNLQPDFGSLPSCSQRYHRQPGPSTQTPANSDYSRDSSSNTWVSPEPSLGGGGNCFPYHQDRNCDQTPFLNSMRSPAGDFPRERMVVDREAKQKLRNRLKKEVYKNMTKEEYKERNKEIAKNASQKFRNRQKLKKEHDLREYETQMLENLKKKNKLAELEEQKRLYQQRLIDVDIRFGNIALE